MTSPASTPLRVALFTDSDVYAGTERHMLELARGLQAEGVAVSLACPAVSALSDRAGAEGIPVIAVEKRGRVDLAAVRQLTALFDSGQIDLLHVHNGRTALLAALAVRRARRGGAIATQHFIDPARAKRRGFIGALSRLASRWVDGKMARLVAVSEAARDAMVGRGEKVGRITVVPNGISEPDRTRLQPAAEVRRHFGVAPEAPLFVCCARLEAEKDIGTLIRAMEQVRAAQPAAVCIVAGEGSQAAELTAQIRAASLERNVLLAGFLADAWSLIHAADLFVLPSLAEPFGLVLLEAMALAKPVVATRAGGPLEIVEEGQTGLLVPPANPAQLATALLQLSADPLARDAMGKRGRARFTEHFTTTQMARATLAVYQRALAART